jgi:TRAP-type C4-dicarboxylate transport system permease small subunit
MGLIIPMMLLIVANVIARFFFNHPIDGAAEISVTIMVILPLGIGWCAIENRHIVIDEIIKRFPSRVAAIIDSITLLAALGITGIITWRLLVSALFEYKYKTIISLTVQIPAYPFWSLFVLAWAVFFLVVISKVYESIKEAVKR